MDGPPASLSFPVAPPAPQLPTTSHSHSPASASPATAFAAPAPAPPHKRKASELEDSAAAGAKKTGKGKGKARDEEDGDEGSGEEERNRPSDCTWDVFQPANDAFLPPSLARTSDLEQLAARLAHVEAYLGQLPPNFALFKPLEPGALAAAAAEVKGRVKKEGAEEGFSDTEDASVALENGVFNGRLDLPAAAPSTALPLPPPARPALAPSTSSFSQRAPALPFPTRFGAPPTELTPALTSILSSSAPPPSSALKASLSVEFDATPAEMEAARRAEVERILKALPGREAVDWLVERYFGNVAWLFNHVHGESFRHELASFHSLCDATPSRALEVDLFWLSLLLMILCLALDSMHFKRSPLALDGGGAERAGEGQGGEDPLRMYTEEQRRLLPERWFAASMRALKLAEWESVPRVRSIQTIILFTQYLQLSSATRGQPSQQPLWLAGAIRLAQVLGLHLLGNNPETMPPEDPAWPPGRNSLKREMAKRLWAVLVYQDWLGANSRNRSYMISPHHFDTDDPSNVNDADLSPSTSLIQPAPSSVLTDSSATRIRTAMARQVRAVFDRVVLARDWSHDTVLELDAGFRAILDELPERWTLAAEEDEPPMLRFQRHFVLEGLHNRIFRLHRPLLGKAGKNAKLKFSADACLKSARAVVVSTHNIREAVADIPYTYSHVLGAALVLFNDLFQAIDSDLSAPEISSKISTLHLALEIFSSSPSSPALLHVVKQGYRILSGLFREEERRRESRAARALLLASAGGATVDLQEEEPETFAAVLQRIARSLNADSAPHRGTPPPTRNIPSKAAGAGGEGGRGLSAPPLPLAGDGALPLDSSAAPPTSLLAAYTAGAAAADYLPSASSLADSAAAGAAEAVYPFPAPQPPLFDFTSLGFGPSPSYSSPADAFGGYNGASADPSGFFSSLGMGMGMVMEEDHSHDFGSLGLGLGVVGDGMGEYGGYGYNGGGGNSGGGWSNLPPPAGDAYAAPVQAQSAVVYAQPQQPPAARIAEQSAEQYWGTSSGGGAP
ncbi:hypothetical protein JCM10213v2_003849 [Rhodosporidiobolus nylandii]